MSNYQFLQLEFSLIPHMSSTNWLFSYYFNNFKSLYTPYYVKSFKNLNIQKIVVYVGCQTNELHYLAEGDFYGPIFTNS